ncbi:MAG: hydrogenase [Nitrospiraceae bacterium]|nr:MAG: hydrogenase [Nitrospiraceae bacterium]
MAHVTSHVLVVVSGLGALVSGLPAALCGKKSNAAQVVSTVLLVAANILGVIAVGKWWLEGPAPPLVLPSPIRGVTVSIAMDGVSAFFLLPILLVTAMASIYGLQYWRQSEHEDNGRRVSLFLGLMTGAMTLLVAAHDGLMFLAAWETMAVSALFLVAAEDHVAETRKAAWLYIAASHFATLCAFGVFALLYAINGTWEFAVLKDAGTPLAWTLAVLAFVGFGTKAGIMPMHVWLPSAHAQAPSHVSAVMSGVLIKMGIYGIVRVCTFFPEMPVSWGLIVLAMGTVSAILGVAFAIAQHDIKRLLAYHSIENIGIIVMGLGLALVGRSMQQPVWVLLGICGAGLHVWNHALFKSLLFLSAGSVIHGVGTREMDVMGGLSKRMPVTANCFLLGAVAICGLPPLNGFVSELLIYLGLFHVATRPETGPAGYAVFAAPGLAVVGALAVACFVKVYGTVFLGAPRSEDASRAHEAGRAMIIPMLVLAGCCAWIGIAPITVAPFLDRLAAAWAGKAAGESAIAASAPLLILSLLAAGLLVSWGAGTMFLRVRGVHRAPRGLTWDCGYAAPSARMQYTSSSFAEMLVKLFRWVLQPKVHPPDLRALFPEEASFESHVEDTVLEKVVRPSTRAVIWLFAWGRYLQSGSLQAYLMYIMLIIIFLLLWR